jgi:hypothetical protein
MDRDPKDKGRKHVRNADDLTLRETVGLLIDLWRAKPWKKEPINRHELFQRMKKEGPKK